MKSNLAQHQNTNNINADSLPGDVVVSIYNGFPLQDRVHRLIAVCGDQVWIQTEIGVWTVNKKFVRSATTAEIQANRRLTEAEQAIAEVS
ncbi:hypothetical protein ACNPQK_18065 [Acinetobacter guillouiae]|uniref:hypothetical protein n=1 Tax=Acinetobacter guillouiae TaxID=106649 RepID=UPI003AF5B49E